MSLLSSTTLFNFTDSFDHLKDNLLNGFYAVTSFEKLPKRNNGYSVPMVCFCDIPLSMIKDHLDWYGKFGIGIKRSYARKHGVTPVFYLHSDNPHLGSLLNETNHNNLVKNLFPLMKQFLGFQEYKGKPRKKKFYDEHEWRYIPPDAILTLHLNESSKKINRNLNKQILRMPLDYDSIEYIIIENADYIDDLLRVFNLIKKRNNVNRDLLISKILTATQINKDF